MLTTSFRANSGNNMSFIGRHRIVFQLTVLTLLFITAYSYPTRRCIGKAANIMLLMDSSSSIWIVDYKKQLDFAQNLVDNFDIGTSDTQVRMGAITFSNRAHLEFSIDKYTDSRNLKRALGNIPYRSGQTNTAEALQLLKKEIQPKLSIYKSPFMAIVITDGRSRDTMATSLAAKKLHELGVHVYAIGVGSNCDINELRSIVNDRNKNVRLVDSYSALQGIAISFGVKTCRDITTTSSQSPSTTVKTSSTTSIPTTTNVVATSTKIRTSNGPAISTQPGTTTELEITMNAEKAKKLKSVTEHETILVTSTGTGVIIEPEKTMKTVPDTASTVLKTTNEEETTMGLETTMEINRTTNSETAPFSENTIAESESTMEARKITIAPIKAEHSMATDLLTTSSMTTTTLKSGSENSAEIQKDESSSIVFGYDLLSMGAYRANMITQFINAVIAYTGYDNFAVLSFTHCPESFNVPATAVKSSQGSAFNQNVKVTVPNLSDLIREIREKYQHEQSNKVGPQTAVLFLDPSVTVLTPDVVDETQKLKDVGFTVYIVTVGWKEWPIPEVIYMMSSKPYKAHLFKAPTYSRLLYKARYMPFQFKKLRNKKRKHQ
ncbi:collagen alpha-1(XII) chain [Octopus bimaculoides]|uniref:VWFA domain-containing protein n=1 Tax=Octopus bimaculoides TaxID=37653 RepID=A0A0L8HL63_OCTBM|nr:collagen alpha-1(XII) chain [Octopus bimaculoides]